MSRPCSLPLLRKEIARGTMAGDTTTNAKIGCKTNQANRL